MTDGQDNLGHQVPNKLPNLTLDDTLSFYPKLSVDLGLNNSALYFNNSYGRNKISNPVYLPNFGDNYILDVTNPNLVNFVNSVQTSLYKSVDKLSLGVNMPDYYQTVALSLDQIVNQASEAKNTLLFNKDDFKID